MNSLTITYILISLLSTYIIVMINKKKSFLLKGIYLFLFFLSYILININIEPDIFMAILTLPISWAFSGLSVLFFQDTIIPLINFIKRKLKK